MGDSSARTEAGNERRSRLGRGCGAGCLAVVFGVAVLLYVYGFVLPATGVAPCAVLGLIAVAWLVYVATLPSREGWQHAPLWCLGCGLLSLAFYVVALAVTYVPPGARLPDRYHRNRGEASHSAFLDVSLYWIAPFLRRADDAGMSLYLRGPWGTLRRVAGPAYRITGVSWSPDGRRLAYHSMHWDATRDLIGWFANIVHVSGLIRHRRPSVQPNFGCRWSADGRRILYEGPDYSPRTLTVTGRDGPPHEVMWGYVSPRDWPPPVQVSGPPPARPIENADVVWQPEWARDVFAGYPEPPRLIPSPDGRRLAVVLNCTPTPGGPLWPLVILLFAVGPAPLALALASMLRGRPEAARQRRIGILGGLVLTIAFCLANLWVALMLAARAISIGMA